MPYHTIKDLPQNLQETLPTHAQEIYIKAFNNALKEYQDKEKRQYPSEDPEQVAHKVAWAAVKEKYHKDEKSGKWVENK